MKKTLLKILGITLILNMCLVGLFACGDSTSAPESGNSVGLEYEMEESGYVVTDIGTCRSRDIVIPSTYNGEPVIAIGERAFLGCGLTSVVIPDSVTSIRDSAFGGCSLLTNVTIPDSVTSIGEGAFHGCSGLTSVIMPDSITSIGMGAFKYCASITSIKMSNSITVVKEETFFGCMDLTKVYYKGTANEWNNITIYNKNDYNTEFVNATRYFYSETEPTNAGNYWHYDTDGKTILEWTK